MTPFDRIQRDWAASNGAGWLATLRRFLVFIAAGNLASEIAQLPLYTIRYEANPPGGVAFAVAHCTGGDILLLLALPLLARPTGRTRPTDGWRR